MEQEQKVRGGARPGAGRKKSDKTPNGQTVSVWLDAEDVEYLKLFVDGNNSLAVRELIARARKMWPKG